jgi:hypothetical protein
MYAQESLTSHTAVENQTPPSCSEPDSLLLSGLNLFLRAHDERLVVGDSGFGLCDASRSTIIVPSALVIIHAHDLESDDADFEAVGIRYPRC